MRGKPLSARKTLKDVRICGVEMAVSTVMSGVEIDDVNVGVVSVVDINGECFFASLLMTRVMDLALECLSFCGFLVVCKCLFVFVCVVVCVLVGGVVVVVVVTDWSSWSNCGVCMN